MNKTLLSILNKVMSGEISPESASRLIAVLYGELKNATCAQDYQVDTCPIFKISNPENTFENGCGQCGHYRKII
jgi:hypothetical protein